MKQGLVTAFAIFLVVSMTAVAAPSASDGAVTSTYNVSGFVYDAEENTGLYDVTVSIWTSTQNWSSTTDYTGKFTVIISENANLMIGIDKDGYAIRSCPSSINKVSGGYTLDLTTAQFDPGTNTYDLTYGAGNIHYILMTKALGTLTGTVTCQDDPVQGAKVTLSNESARNLYSTVTDSDGKYTIYCTGDTYSMSITHTGLKETVVYGVTVPSDGTTIRNETMDVVDRNIYFGLDISHLLMIAGAIIGIFGLLAAILVFFRVKNGQSDIIIIDDDAEEPKS